MKFPLGTSAGTVRSAPLLLIDLESEEGITGRTYLFCYRVSALRAIDIVLRDVVKGEPVTPLDIGAKLARRWFRERPDLLHAVALRVAPARRRARSSRAVKSGVLLQPARDR